MAWFKDFDRLTPFIAAFRPRLAKSMDDHVEKVYKEMISNWEHGQNAKGEAWEPLAASTIARKGHSTPLIEQRQMIDSATYDTDRTELTAHISITDDEGKVGMHEFGAPDQGVPARPILAPVKDVLEEEADSIFTHGFDAAWRDANAGLGLRVGFGGTITGGGAP